jgi:putative GTP pyrophosphokinase
VRYAAIIMIAKHIRNRILAEYDEKKSIFDDYCAVLVRLSEDLCHQDRKLIHSMDGRVKSRPSLQGKLRRPEKAYSRLSEITDIVGVRIITHYGRDVDRIAETIRHQFTIDEKNSADKRSLLDPDRFGYLSLHLVATMTSDRLALAEHSRFRGYRAEIQIRSILQHAWAEITHDLDYKSSVTIPREARRAFFQVAGLLELADNEFGRVRDVLANYRVSVPAEISRDPRAVYVDRDSLTAFATTSSLVRKIDQAMADAANVGEVAAADWMERYVSHLEYFDIQTIADLAIALIRNEQLLKGYAAARLAEKQYARLWEGVSIAYLPYFLALERGGKDGVFAYFRRFGLFDDDTSRRETAELVFKLKEGDGSIPRRVNARAKAAGPSKPL